MSAITAILVATLLGQGYYSPEEAQTLFQQANEAFLKQDYPAARDGYEKLLSHGFGGPDIHYNLGTTYLAQGDLGHAVLAFERSRRAGGEGPDLEANFALAKAQQLDKVVGNAPEEPFLHRVVAATSGNLVSWLFLGTWGAAFAFLLLFRVLRPGRRTWAAVVAGVLLVASLPSGALLAAHVWVHETLHEAVVIAPTLRAREFPKEEAKVSFEVHPGLKVRVMEETGRYVRIRLPNGLEGWAEREGIAEI
ncbi:aerotolerance regulator BatE [Vitiosangium sp. GDMCC 1.1324]|uniref:aerotolerance regulator BatE n=1 Tax=Vitiosangium sp. (strain GDMCC 1.1324) TaxID=2138576 RepID=UPI000D3A5F24|nr:aerotolerance regulator BatE [Vitiosangium sp. GDMCC 1.1324]PTL78421.1 aerotolerance regulator BatE [Vitiosangium sp. GDMCC 1.1324]